MDGFVYLASPYSHADLTVMEERHVAACAAAAELMAEGYAVFSPIAHSHPISDHMEERYRTDFEFWMKQDLPVLAKAAEMVVLILPGWRESRGLTRERDFCEAHNIPIRFYELGKGFV